VSPYRAKTTYSRAIGTGRGSQPACARLAYKSIHGTISRVQSEQGGGASNARIIARSSMQEITLHSKHDRATFFGPPDERAGNWLSTQRKLKRGRRFIDPDPGHARCQLRTQWRPNHLGISTWRVAVQKCMPKDKDKERRSVHHRLGGGAVVLDWPVARGQRSGAASALRSRCADAASSCRLLSARELWRERSTLHSVWTGADRDDESARRSSTSHSDITCLSGRQSSQ
jgi:hypothetical protein